MKFPHLVAIFFFCAWLFLGLNLSQTDGLTFDEPIHLKAGKLFNQGIYTFDPMETPLIRLIVARAGELNRLAVVSLTGLLLIYISNFLDLKSKFIFYFLALTEVNLLAHGHLFTTDLISSLFAFLFFLHISRNKPNKYLTFVFFALSLASKVATLAFIFPICLIYHKKLKPSEWLFSVLCSLIFIWATYGFTFLPIVSNSTTIYPLGGYIRTIKENILFSLRGQPIYFFDQIYQKSPWWKTPLILLIKIPFPLLLVFILTVRRNLNKSIYLIFLFYLTIQSFKSLNFGIRHLLIIDLALIFYLSKVRQHPLILSLSLLLFCANYPYFISFVNPYVSRQELILSDSDLDWGQGLPAIRDYASKNNLFNFQLAYFGTDNPSRYLQKFDLVTDSIDFSRPIFISATCFHTCNLQNLNLLKKRSYTLIGGSILYFP